MAEIKALTGTRGIAALLVFAFHTYWVTGASPTGFWGWTSGYGWVGVDLFFVLSGFVLARSLARTEALGTTSWRQFVARRWLRIAPPYYAAIVLALVFAGNPWFPIEHPRVLLLHLVYGANADVATVGAINICFWSLAVEFQIYLILPFLVRLVAWRPAASVAATGALALLWPLVLVREGHAFFNYWVFTQAPLFILHFTLGVLAQRLSARGLRIARPGAVVAGALALLALSEWALQPPRADLWTLPDHAVLTLARVPAAIAAFFVVYVLATTDSWASRTLSLPPAVMMGRISYSFYLVHLPLVQALNRWWPDLAVHGYVVFSLLSLVASLAVAGALYILVERPALQWKGFARAPTAGPAPEPSAAAPLPSFVPIADAGPLAVSPTARAPTPAPT